MELENNDNFATEALYRDVLGEFSVYKNVTTKGTCAHWLVPTPTLHADVSSSRVPFDSKFKFKVCRPRPFIAPANVNPTSFKEGDPFELIVQEKDKWECDLNILIRKARKGKKWADVVEYGLNTDKVRKKDADKPLYTVNSYLDVAKHIDKDPHPYFSGNYNWLASGGCVNNHSVNGDRFLLFPCGQDIDALQITGLEKELVCESGIKTSIRLAEKQRIYQVVAKCQENRGIVGVRQTKTCSIVSVRQGSKKPLTARTLLEIQEKDGVFTSVDLDCLEDDKFCTLDSDHLLKLWDLNTSSCTASGEVQPSEYEQNKSSWGFAKFSYKPNVMFALNRSCVFVKDQRLPLSKNVQEFCPKPILDDCEEISLLLDSSSTPMVYIGTSHRLLSLDLRFGWTQRWTHLLQAPPMYGSIFYDPRKSEEVILLSSYIPDDAVAIVNRCDQKTSESETFPVGLPSLGDCLLLARTRGQCLGRSFGKRLEMATTGLTLLSSECSKSFTLFKSNSIGDVFSQRFLCERAKDDLVENHDTEEEISNDVNALMMWEDAHNEICSKQNSCLACPVSSCDTIFNCIKAPLAKDKDSESAVKLWQLTFPTKDRQNETTNPTNINELLCELGSYKDLMAKVLLQAWDSEGLTTPPEPRKYVESWLDTVSNTSQYLPDDEDAPSTSRSVIPCRTPRLMSAYNLRSVGKNLDDSIRFKVPTTPPSVLKKKIKRESLGF